MTNSLIETQKDSLSPDSISAVLEEPEAKEYKILTELSDEAKLKMELIEAIRHAGDRQTRKEKIEEAAKRLDKSPRTIRRMLAKVEQEGLVALAETVRSDKGQFRIDPKWQEFIIKTYKQGNRNGLRRSPYQVWKLVEAKAKTKDGLKDGEFPSHVTVYKILEPLIDKKKNKVRHPGQGLKQYIQTLQGNLEITHSNQIFQCDHTKLDILLVDQFGEEIGRPYLTTIVDSYSGCIAGFYLGFKERGSFEVGLALRHAFLPKQPQQYEAKYQLQKEWEVRGIPEYLVTDRAKEFKSEHLKQIAVQLGIKLCLRAYPSQGGLVERPFGTINTEFLATLPGYTGSNVQERPKEAEKKACLTLTELEQMLVRFIVDNYNQNPYPRIKNQTRLSRWQSMLVEPLEVIDERELDMCLLKNRPCNVMKEGTVVFNYLKYKGKCLQGWESKPIILRYDPNNVIRLIAYTREKNGQPSNYLGIVQARDETKPLSLWELKRRNKKLRNEGKKLDNSSILSERWERKEFVEDKLKKKNGRRQAEHKKIEQNRQGLNIVELKPKTTSQDSDSQDNQKKKATKKKVLPLKPITLKIQPTKVKAKSARVAIKNWDEFLEDNW